MLLVRSEMADEALTDPPVAKVEEVAAVAEDDEPPDSWDLDSD